LDALTMVLAVVLPSLVVPGLRTPASAALGFRAAPLSSASRSEVGSYLEAEGRKTEKNGVRRRQSVVSRGGTPGATH